MDQELGFSRDQLLHVDITIDEQEPREGILNLVRKLRPDWKAQHIQMKTFTEGITNQLIGCYVGNLQDSGCVLVRLYGRMTELYVNRDREVEMFQVFHAHGCGPEIYCSFQNGICYEFVPGNVLEDRLLQQPSIYRLIAAEMGKIHSIQPKRGRPTEPLLWTKMSHFLSLVKSSIPRTPTEQTCTKSSVALCKLPSYETLMMEMELLKIHLSPLDSPIVLCHNDLLTKNIIYNSQEGTVKFIDYEYADYNYQAFDIGNHFNEFAVVKLELKKFVKRMEAFFTESLKRLLEFGNFFETFWIDHFLYAELLSVTDVDYSLYPSQELQRDWLTAYLQSYKHSTGREVTVTDAEVTRLYIQVCKFSLASNFFWGLWAILQSQYSSINFDFQRYAIARLSYYFEKKEEYFGLSLSQLTNSTSK